MKILLIYPVPPKSHWPLGAMRSRWVPTGLGFLAAALHKAGHTVKVHVREEYLIQNGYDWKAANTHLREMLSEFRPDIVGLSVVTPAVRESGIIAGWAKELCSREVLVVAGGPHPSALPEQMLIECPEIDAIALAEAEQTLVDIADNGLHPDIPGLVYRDNGTFVHTAPRANPADLDSLAPLAYDLFDMNFYTQPSRWMIRWLKLSATNIRTSRGCPNRCGFCAGHIVASLGVRFHSVDYVIDQVLNAVNRFGVEAIHFEDDTIGADRQRLLAICDELSRHGLHRRIRWDCCMRADQVDTELLRCMKASGCIQIEYGFECGTDEALKRIGKNVTIDENLRAARLTREAGIRIFADIMLGLPGETEKDFLATIRFLRKTRPEVISATRLCPLPGTPIFNALDRQVRESINWGQYSYFSRSGPKFNFTAIPDERFERLYNKFDRYVSRPQIIWAMLRDTRRGDHREMRNLTGRLMRFICHHPIRALRVPW